MSTQGDYLTGIADAIRAKEGSSDPIPANTFAERIAQITTGYDTSDATAQASHILSPYTAYGASGKITGTIPSQAGKTITPGTTQQTAISSGTYASGNILVAGDANLKAENIKSGVSIFGVNGQLTTNSSFTTAFSDTETVTFTQDVLDDTRYSVSLPLKPAVPTNQPYTVISAWLSLWNQNSGRIYIVYANGGPSFYLAEYLGFVNVAESAVDIQAFSSSRVILSLVEAPYSSNLPQLIGKTFRVETQSSVYAVY